MGIDFTLLGHDCPLGYPAPVVPVGRLSGRLVVIYASDRATMINVDEAAPGIFVRHSRSVRRALSDFDPYNDRLFGFSDQSVERYAIDDERRYFLTLLARPQFANRNPFMRLSLAKACSQQTFLLEVYLCAAHLSDRSPEFAEIWYATRLDWTDGLAEYVRLGDLPRTWTEIEYFLIEGQVRFIKRFRPWHSFHHDFQRSKASRDERELLSGRRLEEFLTTASYELLLVEYGFARAIGNTDIRNLIADTLYERMRRELLRTLRGYASLVNDLDDIVNEALLTFHQMLTSDRELKGDPLAIVSRIAKNAASDRLKENRRHIQIDIDSIDPEVLRSIMQRVNLELPDRAADALSEADIVSEMNNLPTDVRNVFVLRALEGFTIAEIGKILGLTQVSVRHKYASAQKYLRSLFGRK